MIMRCPGSVSSSDRRVCASYTSDLLAFALGRWMASGLTKGPRMPGSFTGSGRRWVGTAAGIAVAVAMPIGWAAGPAVAAPHSDAAKPPAGVISAIAGGVGGPGPATSVGLDFPATCSTVHFAAGHLYIADQTGAVRTVNTRTGLLRTPAGVGLQGFSADGVPAAKAELNRPCAAIADPAGNLLIADTANGRVLVAAARSGTFYGRKMTAGDI